MSSKLTINLDSTVLSHSKCIRALKWKVLDGYTEPVQSSAIIYGVAVHKYIDTMFRTKSNYEAAKEAAIKAFNIPKQGKKRMEHLEDERHMLTTSIMTWENWVKKDNDYKVLQDPAGQPMTEFTFSIKFWEDETLCVNLCGTMDSIGKMNGGIYTIRDWKTTSSWDPKEYFSQYAMSKQLRIYALALRTIGRLHPDSLIGAVIKDGVIGAVIDGIFIKPNVTENKWLRSEGFAYRDRELDEMENLLIDKCEELSRAVKFNRFPKQGLLNEACLGKWGKCMFWNACGVSDPKVEEIVLNRDLVKKTFDPLKYNEVVE